MFFDVPAIFDLLDEGDAQVCDFVSFLGGGGELGAYCDCYVLCFCFLCNLLSCEACNGVVDDFTDTKHQVNNKGVLDGGPQVRKVLQNGFVHFDLLLLIRNNNGERKEEEKKTWESPFKRSSKGRKDSMLHKLTKS